MYNIFSLTEQKKYFLAAKLPYMLEFHSMIKNKIPMFEFLALTVMGEYNDDKSFVEEITALSDISGLPFNQIFLVNFVYELWSACTSVVVRDKNNLIFHGRNLDYPFQQYFSKLVATGHFYKNGKLLYSANIFAGCVGIFEGTRVGGFGVSLNARFGSGDIFANFVNYDFISNVPVSYKLRKVLENKENFQEALHELEHTKLGAKCYLTVSGLKNNEGAILERYPLSLERKVQLDENQWFIVITNHDKLSIMDSLVDFRRIPAEMRILTIEREGITPQKLFDEVMSKYPNFNDETIVSTVMTPLTGAHNATTWWADN